MCLLCSPSAGLDRVWPCRLDCVLCAVSCRSAFAHRWRVAGKASERRRRMLRRWRGGAGRDFTFYSKGCVRKPPMASMGRRSCSVRRPVRALAFQGSADEPEALPAGSPALGLQPHSHSGFVHFWSVPPVMAADATREAGKRQWAHSPGPAPRVGTLGIISKEHFLPIPSLVSDIPAWVGCPSHRCPGLGSEGRSQCCPSSGRNGFVLPVIVGSNVTITILF